MQIVDPGSVLLALNDPLFLKALDLDDRIHKLDQSIVAIRAAYFDGLRAQQELGLLLPCP